MIKYLQYKIIQQFIKKLVSCRTYYLFYHRYGTDKHISLQFLIKIHQYKIIILVKITNIAVYSEKKVFYNDYSVL